MEPPVRLCVTLLGIFLSVGLQYDCKKLDGYKFPVYSTELCPRNQTEWNERSSAINCTKDNGYLCFPNEKFTQLLEFCYRARFIWIEGGYCLYLRKEDSSIKSYSCSSFQSGCHNSTFLSYDLFKHPSCTSIGNGCFLAEPSCKGIDTTTHPPESTESIHVEIASMNANKTLIKNEFAIKYEVAMIPILYGVLISIFCIACIIYRKVSQPRKRSDDEEQHTETALELSPLIQTEKHDNAVLVEQVNEEEKEKKEALVVQGISSTEEEKEEEGEEEEEEEESIKNNQQDKTGSIANGIQLRTRRDDEEQHTTTALELSPSIRTDKCDNAELVVQEEGKEEERVVEEEDSIKNNQQDKTGTTAKGWGYKEVQFHMAQDCLRKTSIRDNAIDAVFSIVGCHRTHIYGNSFDESNNNWNLKIDKLFLKKLLSLTHEEKNKLRKLFDYFIVDFITIYLKRTQENLNESHHNDTHKRDEKTADRPKQGCDNLSEYDNIGTSLSPRPSAISKLMKTKGGASSQPKKITANYIDSFKVCIDGVRHISCLTSNKMWVSDFNSIEEIDNTGKVFMKLAVNFGFYGRHTVTREGNLLFLKNNSVYILTSNGDIRNLDIRASENSCIYASRINSDIFIGAPSEVNRYSESGKTLLKIQRENLYGRPFNITENTNGDIIVSDEQRKTIVAVDRIGRHRFNYRGNHSLPEFNPRGICTDAFGHILVCNHSYHDPSVHLLDENGQFLTSLLTKFQSDEVIDLPQVVCVDDKHNLYVGCWMSKVIYVYKYRT